jgi:hypothetical protein
MSNILNYNFSYLELTAFEADFESLNYGNAALNQRKEVLGDLSWEAIKGLNKATIRNVGNTRMQMAAVQNDMGLGKTDGVWNIRYGTKVGKSSAWSNYWPEESTMLEGIFGLAAMDQIDFAIEVLKFPTDQASDYTGKMTLSAHKAEDLMCAAE